MKTPDTAFDEHEVLHDLRHYLPAQAPLKDFIHHNTLHAFQQLKFPEATRKASEIFGYKVALGLDEFRALYHSKRISAAILENVILKQKGAGNLTNWLDKVLSQDYKTETSPRIGTLRSYWKKIYRTDLDSLVHPLFVPHPVQLPGPGHLHLEFSDCGSRVPVVSAGYGTQELYQFL